MRDFQLPGRSPVYATNGMVATSHPLAASQALDILKSGGNAVDAAIAGAVLLGICEPHMTGIGGDCFVLLSPPGEDRILALNGSGSAPAGVSADAIRAAGHTKMTVDTADAITLPGAVDAFCRLSAEWGKLGLDRLLAPAIHYAETGVPVAPRVQFDWNGAIGNLQGDGLRHFSFDGHAPKVGQIFRAPGQAQVLRKIAQNGRAGFYEGPVAEDMVTALSNAGGTHTLDDFSAVQAMWSDPISGFYKDVELVEHPPNGQGATAILLANILSHFDLPALDPNGARRVHIEAEATKLAYDARNRFLADPDYMTRLNYMTAPETAQRLANLIDLNRAIDSATRISEAVHKDTVLITVVDRDGMAVSLIYSIFRSFGSGIASKDYGILFHNRGSGFSLETGHPNEIGPGKRPMHTILPAMLRENGKVTATFGVMGGQYQATGHAHVLTNMVDFGMHPQAALDAPRAWAEDNVLNLERGYSDTVAADLATLGHQINRPEGAIGGAQMIRINAESGLLEGASDHRKDGCAIGY